MNLIKRQTLLPGGRKVNILLPETVCPDITVTDDSKGYCYLISNGTGYVTLTDIFALATSLENNEIIYYPLDFAHIDAYKHHFSELENHYKGIVIFNFNTTKINAKDISTVLKTKIYKEEKLIRQTVFSEEYPNRWNTRRKLTVKSAGELLIISGEREVFTSMAQSCANLSKYGDDATYNQYPAHEHHDWDENTAKSIGITFYYWHSK
jgi:hypothetical protein